MNKNLLSKLTPHLIAIGIFIAISMAFFSPVLQGKKMKQHDIQQYIGMSKEISDFRDKTGEEALWTNSMFGGMPAYQISIKYPGNLIQYVDRVITLYLPHPINVLFLSLLGFYFLLIVLGAESWLAIGGAIAFAFSSYFFIILQAGHNTKAHAIALMAPVLAGIILTYRGRLLQGGVITAIALALQIYVNHLQITYYLAITIGFYLIYQLYLSAKEKQMPLFLKASGILVLGAVFALGCNITSLWATYEYGQESIRGKSELTNNVANQTTGLDRDYVTHWSYGVGETFSLMIPNFKGGGNAAISEHYESALKGIDPQYKQYIGNMDMYWGDQPGTSGPVYAGAIICFLFILGLFIVKDRMKWWLLAATVLSILLAWGKNFMPFTDFFLDYVPGYNKFRSVSMTLVIAGFTMPILALLAVREVVLTPRILIEKRKAFIIALALTAGFGLLLYIAPTAFQDFLKQGEYESLGKQLRQGGFPDNQVGAFISSLEDARKNIFTADVLRSVIFILLAAAALYVFALNKIKKNVLFAVLGLLILVDMWGIDKRYLSEEKFVSKSQSLQPYEATAADLQILQDKDPDYRVFNTTLDAFSDAGTSYYHKSIGGYHGAKLRRYNELIMFQIDKQNMEVFNILNTKYFIVNDANNQPVAQRNPGALGNAWFVKDFKIVANADSELAALTNFKALQTAIVDKRFVNDLQGFVPTWDSTAMVKLISYAPNHLVYETHAKAEQLAIFSEIYYNKGWNAYIDGKSAPYFRANYVLRAMRVPAGQHQVEFKFEPKVYKIGEKISLASSGLLLLLLAGVIFMTVKKED